MGYASGDYNLESRAIGAIQILTSQVGTWPRYLGEERLGCGEADPSLLGSGAWGWGTEYSLKTIGLFSHLLLLHEYIYICIHI